MVKKKHVYKMVCAILQDYDKGEYDDEHMAVEDMYDILCVIRDGWDKITSEKFGGLTPL